MALQQREIGERIAKLRKSRGNPPQEVVAQQLGVSYRAYQAWEAGDAKPAYRNLSKLAAFFGVTEALSLRCQPTACGGRESNKSRAVRVLERDVRKTLAEELADPSEEVFAGDLASFALVGGEQGGLVLHRRSSWTYGRSIPWRPGQTPGAGDPRNRDEHRTPMHGRHHGSPTSTHPPYLFLLDQTPERLLGIAPTCPS
jgi:transcriptional regulator with XRE-family HTH domain